MKSEITFSEIRLKQEGEYNPLIVEFLNGDIPEEKLSTVKAKLIPHESLHQKAIEIYTSDKQKYVNDPINKFLLESRFIAIRNKKTNKMRLVEAEFTPVINALFFAKEGMKEDKKDIKERYATLQKMFGTKRAIRRLEQKEALEIDRSHVENQINEMLENTPAEDLSTVNESFNKTKTEIEEECLSKLIPPCHRDAVNVIDVYKVEDCISEKEITSLANGVQHILKKGSKSQDYSPFLQAHLPAAFSASENLNIRLSCLLYADALVNYLRTQAKSLAKLAPTFCPYSEMIGRRIISEFCVKTGSSINRPLIMKDKAVCYIIVLTLIACNYSIDLEALAKLTSYGFNKMKQLGRIVGVIPAGKATNVYTLVLPLLPPVTMVKKSKGAQKR